MRRRLNEAVRLGSMAVAAGAAAWVGLMGDRLLAAGQGHVCGHAAASLHCPGCYAALALIGVGLLSLAAGAASQASAMHAPITGRR